MSVNIHGVDEFPVEKKRRHRHMEGCCHSIHTRNCFIATGIFGVFFIIVGLLVLIYGPSILAVLIQKSMPLSPASSSLASWLVPPVDAQMTVYVFNLTNPDQVLQGGKPVLQEVGPFVYEAVTVKDSLNPQTNQSDFKYNKDGSTITYRPRKFYYLISGSPDTTFVTVPNIPFLTGLSGVRDSLLKDLATKVVLNTGHGQPFINVSVSGLLWGYKDELPCFNLKRPDSCPPPAGEIDIFKGDAGWDEEEWDDVNSMREKRSIVEEIPSHEDLRFLNFSLLEKEKGGFVDCKCEWGLFRDRNVTLRKPITVHHGMAELSKKGLVEQFNNEVNFGWWQEGSSCDQVGGQDGPTFAPELNMIQEMEVFISIMCRKLSLKYEKHTKHSGIMSYRFVPPVNSLGSHSDTDPQRRNLANSCYCMQDQGFSCLKSGVFNLEPCKASPELPRGAPIALSYPHFYQADPSYLNAVSGLAPDKSRHQFYVDIEPTYGFPLAVRPRFQLNAIIRRDQDIPIMSNFSEELILPFLWAQDGFSNPSASMTTAIHFGLAVPEQLPLLAGVVLLSLGGVMLLLSVGCCCFWAGVKKSEEFVLQPL